jgi:hypothetical protein
MNHKLFRAFGKLVLAGCLVSLAGAQTSEVNEKPRKIAH